MVFHASLRSELPRPAAPPTPPEPVVTVRVPRHQEVSLGDGHTVRIQSISMIVLIIAGKDGGTFTVRNNHFIWRGYRILAMVQKGRVDLTLPEKLADELGIEAAALVPA